MTQTQSIALMIGWFGNAVLVLEHVFNYHRAGLSLKGLWLILLVALLPGSLVAFVLVSRVFSWREL